MRRFARVRTIRAKLILIVAVPTSLLMVLAALGVAAQWRSAGTARGAAATVKLVLTSQDLVHSLQRERGLTNGMLGGAAGYRPQVDAQRAMSDRARTALDNLLSGTSSPAAGAVRASLAKLAALGTVRGSVDAGKAAQPDTLAFYTAAIEALNGAAFDSDAGQDDAGLRRGMDAMHALADVKEATALERGFLNGVFAAGSFRRGEYARFAELRAAKVDALGRFGRLATPAQNAALDVAQRTRAATVAAAFEQRALGGAAGGRLGVDPVAWWDAMTTLVDDLRNVQQTVGADVTTRARNVTGDREVMFGVYGGSALLLLVLALMLWLVTYRSIMRPLGALTADANDAATRRLPVAVSRIQAADNPDEVAVEAGGPAAALVHRDDEFAEVAAALDNVQQTAVRLAVEQAVMRRNTAESLANLGRRNQNLVRRQLGFISALEREETDPAALGNLFELDHLATRMRRNAESLLVLVGEHSPRRWTGSVNVGDVLRSSFAEVEDYRRVVIRQIDNAKVRGTAAAEIAHLLAELIENALTFSPPDRDVEIHARGDGAAYHIAIVDHGIGMSAEDMARANARLRGEQSFLVAPARDLGHYVVGRLASRLNIKVWLHESPLIGVTARVDLPGTLLEDPAGAEPMTVLDRPALVAGRIAAPTEPVRPGNPRKPTAPAPTAPVPTGAEAGPRVPPGRVPAMTRHGLVRRVPGATRHPAAGAMAQPAPPPAPADGVDRAAPGDRSNRDVRAMLNSFRSGVYGTGSEQQNGS